MWGMAARLSDPTIDGIAAFYASQTPVAGEPSASPETAAGKRIFTEGIPSESLPACMSCHGEKAEGNGPIPRLAGQHRAYLARQLEAFAAIARANEIMHENSKDLTLSKPVMSPTIWRPFEVTSTTGTPLMPFLAVDFS